jgi:hypothetical protein
MALFASLNYFLKWVFLQCRALDQYPLIEQGDMSPYCVLSYNFALIIYNSVHARNAHCARLNLSIFGG